MKKLFLSVLLLIFLSACASHTPAPEPQGKPFPINQGYTIKGEMRHVL